MAAHADIDGQETREWVAALDSVVAHDGPERAGDLPALIRRVMKDIAEASGRKVPALAPDALVALADHSVAISQDIPAVDSLGNETSATVPGLDDPLYTWNVVSPRLGATVRLTDDGRTILRRRRSERPALGTRPPLTGRVAGPVRQPTWPFFICIVDPT